MNNINNTEFNIVLNDLRETCRYQLINYPDFSNASLKRKSVSIAKNLLAGNIKLDRFFWPNGLLAIALENTHKQNNNPQDLECLIAYYDKWIESGLKINHLDNVINGYSMIYVYENTKDIKYKYALDTIVEYVKNHPKDKYNSLPYRMNNTSSNLVEDIYIDSLGMICPFLCRYGKLTNNKNLTNLGIDQLINFIELGFDESKNLPYHAYNAQSKVKLGIIGWGRAVGWILIGLIDSLEYIDLTHEKYEFLSSNFIKIVNEVVNYQNTSGQYSWQLEAFEGHFDSSSTSMISYAIEKAVHLGILNISYENYVMKSVSALYLATRNGYVENCSAECRGLSMYPQIYGWYPWSQGPTTALFSLFL